MSIRAPPPRRLCKPWLSTKVWYNREPAHGPASPASQRQPKEKGRIERRKKEAFQGSNEGGADFKGPDLRVSHGALLCQLQYCSVAFLLAFERLMK